jgi:hypothetical protein
MVNSTGQAEKAPIADETVPVTQEDGEFLGKVLDG